MNTARPNTIQGPAIFLAQFLRPEPPFDTFDGICHWAAGLGYRGVQVPAWESSRLIELDTVAASATYCDDWCARLATHGLVVTELNAALARQGAVKWSQENPNYLDVYRYGEERRVLTRASGYFSAAATQATRVPPGHPEGYLEAFATIYDEFVRAVRAHLDGRPMRSADYGFSNAPAGLRAMKFIHAAVESARAGARRVDLPAV